MKTFLMLSLFVFGSAQAGRMLLSQEGYEDMDAPSHHQHINQRQPSFDSMDEDPGVGPGLRGFSSFQPVPNHNQMSTQDSNDQLISFRPGSGPHPGMSQFDLPPPQSSHLGRQQQFSDDRPQIFDASSFDQEQGQGPRGLLPHGGPQTFASDDGSEMMNIQGWSGPSSPVSLGSTGMSQHAMHPGMQQHSTPDGGHFSGPQEGFSVGGSPTFQGDHADEESRFERDQDSKLSSQLLRDDDDGSSDARMADGQQGGQFRHGQGGFGGGEMSAFDGQSGLSSRQSSSAFGGPQEDVQFDDGARFGPDGGFTMGRAGPKTQLGGAWIGGNMISPKMENGPQGGGGEWNSNVGGAMNGLSQGESSATRLDSATIGARSRQLGIRPPPPQNNQQQQQQMRGGPGGPSPMGMGGGMEGPGPITSSFKKFRPIMMGFRPRPRGHGFHSGPGPNRPMLHASMSERQHQRAPLHFIPMDGGRSHLRDFDAFNGPEGSHLPLESRMPRKPMYAYGPIGEDVSNININGAISGGSVMPMMRPYGPPRGGPHYGGMMKA